MKVGDCVKIINPQRGNPATDPYLHLYGHIIRVNRRITPNSLYMVKLFDGREIDFYQDEFAVVDDDMAKVAKMMLS